MPSRTLRRFWVFSFYLGRRDVWRRHPPPPRLRRDKQPGISLAPKALCQFQPWAAPKEFDCRERPCAESAVQLVENRRRRLSGQVAVLLHRTHVGNESRFQRWCLWVSIILGRCPRLPRECRAFGAEHIHRSVTKKRLLDLPLQNNFRVIVVVPLWLT